jgi:hypothetical protein
MCAIRATPTSGTKGAAGDGMKALAAILLVVACSNPSGPTGSECLEDEGKCDTPKGSHKKVCENSRVSAMDERRPHFTPEGVRWSCRDVNGVTPNGNTNDDRGQEYCEYFTMLHTKGIPAILMDAQGQPTFCDESTPCSEGTCNTSIFSCVTAETVDRSAKADVLGKNSDQAEVTPLDPKLTAGQIEWLAQNPSEKVGECVFTSWHEDITRLPASTETIGGHKLGAETPGAGNKLFRMEVSFNSNGAAKALVEACLTPGDDKIEDTFMRACVGNCDGDSCIPWRKSDPSVCTLAMRIAECGCTVEAKDSSGNFKKLDLSKSTDLAKAQELFVPSGRRGFTLGSWDGLGVLPSGCRYIKMGDSPQIKINGATLNDPHADQVLVACDLTGSHITSATAKDPKEACRLTYGEEVVVHVRAPAPSIAKLTCDPNKCEGVPWDLPNL